MPHEKVNVNGGAIAMGHPLGATGAMILGTLIDELRAPQAALRPGHAVRGRRHGHRHHRRAGLRRHENHPLRARRRRHRHASPSTRPARRSTPCAEQWQDDLTEAVGAGASKDKDAHQGHHPRLGQETFFAGADLKDVMQLQPSRRGRACFAEIERDEEATSARSKRWASRWCAASTARRWAAAGRWRWSATTASPSTTARSSSACPR